MAFADDQSVVVTIPKGTASPEVNITKLTPTQWYTPARVSVNQNDSVIWINKDTEIHTVTSGNGAGLESLMTNKPGTKNGIFDSGIIQARRKLDSPIRKRWNICIFLYRYIHGWKERLWSKKWPP